MAPKAEVKELFFFLLKFKALVGVNGENFFLLSRNGKSTFVFILLHTIYDILVLLPNVCFKKIWTNYSTVSLLLFVQIFLKQMLSNY